MDIRKICEPLDSLWSVTHMDWDYSIRGSLTEPTCPIIHIAPETVHITRYTAHCDSDKLEETLKMLVDRVVREIINGEVLTDFTTPYTNPDDKIVAEWLEKRKTNKDEPFPSKFFYDRYNKEQGYL